MTSTTHSSTEAVNSISHEDGMESADLERDDQEAEASDGEVDSDLLPESIVEAVLFASDAPLPARRLAMILGAGGAAQVRSCVDALNARYVREGAAFRIESIANGYQMLTLPVYHEYLARLKKTRAETRLSAAALETLSIVAYKQPIIRADIEAIRGVAVGDVLVRLRDLKLVKIVGRAEDVGRPLLYGTTSTFLDVFGLESLDALPPVEDAASNDVPKLRIAPSDEASSESETASGEVAESAQS